MKAILTKSQFRCVLGNSLRSIRIELGLSQEQFAGTAGLGRTHYGAIERGEKTISTHNLYLLLESNGISFASFFKTI